MVVGVDLNGQVTGVAVTDHSESTGMGTMAMENAQLRKYVGMSGTIRTSGANSVVVVTGATATSEAITAGVNQALAIVANLETDGSVPICGQRRVAGKKGADRMDSVQLAGVALARPAV